MIRSLRLRDLGLIARYRNRGLFLDSVPTLTWGRGIVPLGVLLSTFSSLTGVFTSLGEKEDGHLPLLGQVVHNLGSPFAHFTFLAPNEALESDALPKLLEHLIVQVGSRGAHSLTAEVEEEGPAFAALRKAGFSIYARQRIWRLSKAPTRSKQSGDWRFADARDELAIKLLCTSLVPGLVQQVEPSPWDGLRGYVLYRNTELMAYVDIRSGPRGTWLQAFVHMDAQDFDEDLTSLLASLRPSRRRPLYLCLRSYQDWLEPMLRKLGTKEGPRQAVMVKRTARRIKAGERLLKTEGRRTEPTMPIKIPALFVSTEHELTVYD